MKKDNMLKGIFKLISTTFLVCFIGLFLCGIDTKAYSFEEYPEDAEIPTGFYIVNDLGEASVKLEIWTGTDETRATKIGEVTVPAKEGEKSGNVLYSVVLNALKSKGVQIDNGSSIPFHFKDANTGGGVVNFSENSSFNVYKFSDCIKLDEDESTAIGALGYDIEVSDSLGYLIEDEEIKNPTITFKDEGAFANKVKGKYYINTTDDRSVSSWKELTSASVKLDGTFKAGEDVSLYFLPIIQFAVGTNPENTDALKYSDTVKIAAYSFLNEDEDGTGTYDGFEGYSAKVKWTCVTESGVGTECWTTDESEGGPKGKVYETEDFANANFVLRTIDGLGQEGSSTWKFSLEDLSGYPFGKANGISLKDEKTFNFVKTGLCLIYNSVKYPSSGTLKIPVTAGSTLTGVSLGTTSGTPLSSSIYSDFRIVTKTGNAKSDISSTGQIVISNIVDEGIQQVFTVSAYNSETDSREELDFSISVSGAPYEMVFAEDEVTSGLTLRLNNNTMAFYDKNGNLLTDVVIKSVKAEDDDVLEVKHDNSGFYVIGDDAGTSSLIITLADGTAFETPEITVYPMPTVSYESSRQLKVSMPYKVAIPGSKDSLKQVTGFKLYVYHDGDKLGEFDMSDLGLSSYSSSSSDSTGTKTMTVGTAAVEKIITNLANNGKFSGDSMGITFKAVPVGKRKSGGSSTYETNKDKVYGEDSTTVYRVAVSVTGCTVTQSTRYGLNGQEVVFTSDQSSTNWTGVGTGSSTSTGSTAKYTVGTNTTSNLNIKATANGSSNGSTSPVAPGTNSGAANGSGAGGDGLDDVPKTSESNAPMWLIVIVVLAAIGGAYALYLQLRPVTETGYYDEEDDEDRPTF